MRGLLPRVRGAVAAGLLVAGILACTALVFSASAQQPAKALAKSRSKSPAKSSPARRAASTRPQQAPAAARLREIQQALANAGYYQGQPNGKWDDKSISAMKEFQQANELPVTGKIDARSLQRLGLGSDIAGKAPPRAAANTGSPQ